MNKLYILVGLSASGKSTLAEEMGAKVISSDEIRGEICQGVADQSKNQEVFNLFVKRLRESLEKEDTIADATSLTMKDRRFILNAVKGMDVKKICIVLAKRVEDCIRDNFLREHPIPVSAIVKQMGKFEIPFYEEGFDEIIIKDVLGYENKELYSDYEHYMIGMEQHSPHHTRTLDKHCKKAAKIFQQYDCKDSFKKGAYVHDLGKLWTTSYDENGVAHWYSHANVGSYFAMTHFKNDEDLLDICFLMNYHMYIYGWKDEKVKNKYRKIFGEEKFNILEAFHFCDKAKNEEEKIPF